MSETPPEYPKSFPLEIPPIFPDTQESVKEEFLPLVETALREAGHGDLWTSGDIKIEIPATSPDAGITLVLVTLGSKIAYDVWKEIILPLLKRRFGV